MFSLKKVVNQPIVWYFQTGQFSASFEARAVSNAFEKSNAMTVTYSSWRVELLFLQCAGNITIRYLVIPQTIGIKAMLFPSGAQVFPIFYDYPKYFQIAFYIL